MITEMTDEQITSDARRLSEVFYQIGALKGYDYKLSFTIMAYAILWFVLALAKLAGLDEHQEARNFCRFITNVVNLWDDTEEKQKGAS